MPRNSSGTMTLPSPGVPFQSGQTISSAQVNATLTDLATETTSSLDRAGRGGMTAPLRVADGTAAAPAVAFTSEINSGMWRAGATDVRLAVGGVDTVKLAAGGVIQVAPTGIVLIATGTAGIVQLVGNQAAASGSAEVYISGSVTRTAGAIIVFRNGTAADKLVVDYQGLLTLSTPAAAIQPASLWTALTLNAGWTGTASYTKDATGAVRVQASIVFATGGAAAAFNLPAGFRADTPYMAIVDFSSLTCVPAVIAAATGAFTIPNPVNAHAYQANLSFVATA